MSFETGQQKKVQSEYAEWCASAQSDIFIGIKKQTSIWFNSIRPFKTLIYL